MQFGCVLFETPDNGGDGSGWASIEGGIPFRVGSVQDLAQNIRWWTNLTYNGVNDLRGFRSNTVKLDTYLRTKMDHIIQEIGLSGKRPVDMVTYLSYLFTNVMHGAVKHYGADIEKIGSEQSLSHDLAATFQLYRRSDKQSHQIDNSYNNIIYCSGRWQRDVVYTWIRRQRIKHAIDVLSAPVPLFGCKWEPLRDRGLLRRPDIVDFLIKFPQPVLCKVSVKNVAPEVADLIGFGNTANKRQDKIRHWLSQPELMWLSNYASIKIEEVLMGEGYQPAFSSDSFPLRDTLPMPLVDTGFNQLSLSAGLLAENYWVSLANKTSKRNGNSTQHYFSASASWMRSVDLMLIFMDVLKLRNKVDIEFNNYSVGSLSVSFNPAQWDDVFHAAQEVNMFMPLHPPEMKKN